MGRSLHHPVGLIHYAPQHCYRGYTLFSTTGATTGGDHATLIDMEGRICHRWQHSAGIAYGYLLPNGHLLCRTSPPDKKKGGRGFGGSSAGLVELDWESNVVWEYHHPMLHHDYERLPTGNTLVFAWEPMSAGITARVKGGYRSDDDPEQMLGDVIREIAHDGSVVREWRSWEHLNFDEDVICPLEHRQEWTHGNSLRLTPDGDWLVSFRRVNMIGIVHQESGEFIWKWGPGETSHQHDARFLDNGRILLFDNGVHRRGPEYSRVIEVDPETRDIAWEYQGDSLLTFYSFNASGAERLPNGNTLICECAVGRIFEVTPRHDIVWEYINPFFCLDARFGGSINFIFRAHRYGPDHSALRGKDLDPERYANFNRLYNGR